MSGISPLTPNQLNLQNAASLLNVGSPAQQPGLALSVDSAQYSSVLPQASTSNPLQPPSWILQVDGGAFGIQGQNAALNALLADANQYNVNTYL
jgi:hypothetical protein